MNQRGETRQTESVMKTGLKVTAALAAAALLGACAGGGGGGDSQPDVPLAAPSEQRTSAEIAECLIYPNYCREKEKLKNSLQCLLDPFACAAYLEGIKRKDQERIEANGTSSTLPGFISGTANSSAGDSVQTVAQKPLIAWSQVGADALVNSAGPGAYVDYQREPPPDPASVPPGQGPSSDSERRIYAAYMGAGATPSASVLAFDETMGYFYYSGTFEPIGSQGLAAIGQPGIELGVTKRIGDYQSPFVSVPASNVGLIANSATLRWNYQSFGVWNEGGNEGGLIYSRSIGTATPASAVLASGSATFTGKLGGLYISPVGEGSVAAANLTVNADFSSRTLGFASSGTTLSRDVAAATPAPNLNLSGTLSYAPGSNAFSGTLTNAGGTMSGASNGQFYGPAANELGGVFAVKSATTVETFTGAYGAKR
jgi:C-lobe and N-lobe beta barrels of Tf-binding protein B